MFMLYFTIFKTVTISCVWSFSISDPCDIIISSDLSKDNSQVVNITIPKNCQFGNVAWSYPVGSAFISYTSGNKTVQLCIDAWSSELSRVQGLIDGHYKNLPLPTKGSPSCAKSCHGKAVLVISAPVDLHYMISLKYRITEEKSASNH